MLFKNLVLAAQQYFPSLKIKYKDNSILMKILAKLFFFDKTFKDNSTTRGFTIYLPSPTFIKMHPVSGAVIFLHELAHLYYRQKMGIFFNLLYLMPQLLILPSLLLFLISWKVALPVILLVSMLPAYFRMHFEKQAYLSSIYVIEKLSVKLNFNPHLVEQSEFLYDQFNGCIYSWKYGFDARSQFNQAVLDIQGGARPYQSEIFDILDDLISKI
jgi:hypothetical protein